MTNNFCVIPWVSITSDSAGLVRPCCKFQEKKFQGEYQTGSLKENTYKEIWNGDDFKKIRQAFLDNKQIPECKSCWNEEKSGLMSYRTLYNGLYLEDKEYTLEADPPKIVDLKLSNVCNFKCRICNWSYSTAILKEDKAFRGFKLEDEMYYVSNKILGTDNEDYFFNEILPTLAQIEFTGGEPFVNPEGKKMIKRIAQSGYAKNVILLITTNGSIIKEDMLNDFKEFKEVKLTVSLDDVGKRLEYQRHGANWHDILENMLILKQEEYITLSIHPTINNYNIWDIHEILNWAFLNKIEIVINVLHGPDHLSIKTLPNELKDLITKKHKRTIFMQNVLDYMNATPPPNSKSYFTKEIEFMDKIRNESFRDVFPEWSELVYAYM